MSITKAEWIRQAEERMERLIDGEMRMPGEYDNVHEAADELLIEALRTDPDFKPLIELWRDVPRYDQERDTKAGD